MKPPSTKTIIVRYDIIAGTHDHAKASGDALEELERLLDDGWQVTHSECMSGSHSTVALSLVILERI